MCEGEEKPLCVEWCLNDVLIYEEREEAVEDNVKLGDMEVGLEALMGKYGVQEVKDAAARIMAKG